MNRRFLVATWAVLSVLFFTFGTYRNWPYKIESDGKYYYQYLLSLWHDGDFDFDNNYSLTREPWMRTEIDHYRLRDLRTPADKAPNLWPAGSALLWFPFFSLAQLAGRLINATGPHQMELYGWNRYFQYAVMYSAVAYLTLGALLAMRITEKLVPDARAGRWAMVLMLFGTNLAYYAIFEPSMCHVHDFLTFTALLFLLIGLRGQHQPAWFLLLGLVAALHMMIRFQNSLTLAVVSPFVALEAVRSQNGFNRRSLARCVNYLLPPVIAVAISGGINFSLNGSFFHNPTAELMKKAFYASADGALLDFSRCKILSVLFSARNGLFSHHPVLLVGVAGLVLFFRRRNPVSDPMARVVLLLVGLHLLQLMVAASTIGWWSGHAFGQRYATGYLALYGIGFAEIIFRAGRVSAGKAHLWYRPAVLILCAMNTYLTGIHVFLWDYEQPHNIWHWMFVRAPGEMVRLWTGSR